MKRGNSFFTAAALFSIAGMAFSQATNPSQEKPSVKGPWADAKAGMTVRFKVIMGASESAMTQEVVKADDQSVTVRKSVSTEPDKTEEKVEKRLYTQDEIDKRLEKLGKKGDDETVAILGKDIKCEIYTREFSAGGRTYNLKTYVCRDVPGWVVRMDDDKSGRMSVFMELAEIKK